MPELATGRAGSRGASWIPEQRRSLPSQPRGRDEQEHEPQMVLQGSKQRGAATPLMTYVFAILMYSPSLDVLLSSVRHRNKHLWKIIWIQELDKAQSSYRRPRGDTGSRGGSHAMDRAPHAPGDGSDD